MPLPQTTRVVFERNPLIAVVAQFRFPPILRILAETPAQLQEEIRGTFPGYGLFQPNQPGFPADMPLEMQNVVRSVISSQTNTSFDRQHQFSTGDGKWTVQLGTDSFLLLCKAYPRWEIFREKVQFAWDAVQRIYKPSLATSVGLRYQNAIDRKELGLTQVPWKQLLAPFIASQFICEGIEEAEVASAMHRFEFLLDNKDRILVQHGIGMNQATKSPVYAIDNSFSTITQVKLHHVFSRLDELNARSGNLFQQCITRELYDRLSPTPI